MNGYAIVKFVHVLLAILTVGLTSSAGLWLDFAIRTPEHLAFTLRGLRFIDAWLAKPGLVLLLVSGSGLVWLGGWSLTTPWLGSSIIIWAIVLLILAFWFAPTLRRQIQVLETEGSSSPAYRALNGRMLLAGRIAGGLTLVIVFLMVTKPHV